MSNQNEAKYTQDDLERAQQFCDKNSIDRIADVYVAVLIASVRAEAQQALVRIDEIPQQEVDLGLPKTAIAPIQEAEKKTVESLEIFLFETMWKSRSNWKLEDGTDARTFCHYWAKEILHFME